MHSVACKPSTCWLAQALADCKQRRLPALLHAWREAAAACAHKRRLGALAVALLAQQSPLSRLCSLTGAHAGAGSKAADNAGGRSEMAACYPVSWPVASWHCLRSSSPATSQPPPPLPGLQRQQQSPKLLREQHLCVAASQGDLGTQKMAAVVTCGQNILVKWQPQGGRLVGTSVGH